MTFEKEKHIAELVVRYVTGTITAQESEELEAWRSSRPANGEIFDRMLSRTEFDKNVERYTKSGRDAVREWRRIENRGPGKKKHRRLTVARYAAAIAVVAVSVLGYYTLSEQAQKTAVVAEDNIVRAESVPVLLLGDGRKVELTADANIALLNDEHFSLDTANMSLVYDKGADTFTPAIHSLLVPKGSDHRLVLSDNTVVWLNAESSLTYPAIFNGAERRVQLRGEAYFEVAEDAVHPFIVEAGGIDVTVTGTTFGVRAYGNEPVVRTVLESGSVSVSAEGQRLVLQPDMQALFDRRTKAISVGPANAEMLLSWKNGRFAYDGTTLEEIFNDLARWYDFTVTYADEQCRGLRYSLDIRKHAGFASILNIIRATQKVEFEVSGNNVTVKMKK